MEAQGVDLMENGAAMSAALIPMLIFGCIYIVVLGAFIWGFVSMVLSQRRIATALEATTRILQQIADSTPPRV